MGRGAYVIQHNRVTHKLPETRETVLTCRGLEVSSGLEFGTFLQDSMSDGHGVVCQVRVLARDEMQTVELVEQILHHTEHFSLSTDNVL